MLNDELLDSLVNGCSLLLYENTFVDLVLFVLVNLAGELAAVEVCCCLAYVMPFVVNGCLKRISVDAHDIVDRESLSLILSFIVVEAVVSRFSSNEQLDEQLLMLLMLIVERELAVVCCRAEIAEGILDDVGLAIFDTFLLAYIVDYVSHLLNKPISVD